ncbi:MAG TPA: protein kinase [Bryobacteraceae bacterium]|nr:protein kinase [Bryobacteraceae bacterium]
MTGDSVLHYRILEKLGEGGMGVVYKAIDTRLGRPVAIKTVADGNDERYRSRFIWEARAAAKLRHPNIVVIHDIASDGQTDFIVMEYVPGRPLSSVMAAGKLPLDHVIRYGGEIASALEAAHAAGIAHRDLKPSNVMVTDDGTVKLVDFGIARLHSDGTDRQMTRRAIEGTCGYMSPEQARGGPATVESDIFSFGAVLYEMAVGQPAFCGDSQAAVLAALLRDEPALDLPAFQTLPVGLSRVISRCLRKDPKQRYQHIGDARIELEDAAHVPAAPTQPSRRRWRRVVLEAGAALVVTAAGVLFGLRHEPSANSLPVPLTSFRGNASCASWSPDGRQVAFTWSDENGNNQGVYVAQPGSSQVLRLTRGPGEDTDPAWSPDGRWIAYVNRAEGRFSLQLVSALGGPRQTLFSGDARIGDVSWTPDGRGLLAAFAANGQPSALSFFDASTGERRQLTSPEGILGDLGPAVSADGGVLAFTRKTSWRTAELYLMPLNQDWSAAGPARRATSVGYAADPVWMPDGKRVLFEAHRNGAGLWQVNRRGEDARPVPGVPPTASKPALTKRPDGRISLVFTNGLASQSIWRYAIGRKHAGIPLEFAPSTRSQLYPRYSRDGNKLAFSSLRTGFEEIWVADADGSHLVQITDLKHQLTEAGHWSPDGATIPFVSQDSAGRQLYFVPPSGGPPRAVPTNGSVRVGTGWSHDGRTYYYDVSRSGVDEIWKAYPNGAKPELAVAHARGGFETASGTFYYWKHPAGPSDTLMRRATLGDVVVPLLPPACPTCCLEPASGGFYYWNESESDLWFFDESSGRSTRALRRPPKPFNEFTVSPDGRWFAAGFLQGVNAELVIVDSFH